MCVNPFISFLYGLYCQLTRTLKGSDFTNSARYWSSCVAVDYSALSNTLLVGHNQHCIQDAMILILQDWHVRTFLVFFVYFDTLIDVYSMP